jgi:hypothetical protein
MVLEKRSAMSTQEVLIEIQKLPIEEQRQILEALSRNVAQDASSTQKPMSEAQFEQMLLEKGIINQIPAGVDEEEEAFEPVLVEDTPLSETILEERR